MVDFKGFCSKKTLVALALGQFVSLLITSTGFSSSELSRKGINAPTSQSFANYVLLAIVYGSLVIHRRKALQMKWYYYLLLAIVDVEANFLVVKAYQYTSLTSVMLLDCWTIPSVIFLTWMFLKTRYRYRKFIGVGVCVAGLVMVVFSDVHASDRASGSNPVKGDLLVIGGSMLYAISNVSEEFLVKAADRIELMALLGVFGAVISACQIAEAYLSVRSYDRLIGQLLREQTFAGAGNFTRPILPFINEYGTNVLTSVLPFVGFALAMFLFYSSVPILLKMSGSTMLNLSLLTSDMWAVFIRIFAYHEKVDWLYFIAFGAVAVGLLIYSGGEKEGAETGVQVAEDSNIPDKEMDEEAGLQDLGQGPVVGTRMQGMVKLLKQLELIIRVKIKVVKAWKRSVHDQILLFGREGYLLHAYQ